MKKMNYNQINKLCCTVIPAKAGICKKVNQGGVHLSTQEKANLKAFLLTLSDFDFINNPDFKE